MTKVKVLTVFQPWAELLVLSAKKIETKPIRTYYRGDLYIHAAKTFHFNDLELCNINKHYKRYIPDNTKLITGAIIGKVTVIDCVPVEELLKTISEKEKAFGNYAPKRYGWICENAEKFEKPIYTRGNQGLWNYELNLKELSV